MIKKSTLYYKNALKKKHKHTNIFLQIQTTRRQMNLYPELRLKLEPLADPLVWVRAVPKLQPLATITILSVYCSSLHLLHDNVDRRFLYNVTKVKHFPANVTKDVGILGDEVLTVVEEFLDSTYQEDAPLSWKSVLEGPGLRQITLKESECYITNAPKESCETVLVKKEVVNTTCTQCWNTTSMHSHICAEPDPEDGGDGTCVQGCEHGFGFCAELGDDLKMKGHHIPEGGHGLYVTLDAKQTYKTVFKRLRDLQWMTQRSRYVSVFLTTLSNTDTLARVRLHFLKFLTGQWTITYDITLIRLPNYFPKFFHDKALLKKRPTCDKVLHYFVRGPRDRHFRHRIQLILLMLPALLLLLTAIESPYLITTRDPTWEDHVVLVINLAGLGLHVGLCVALFMARVMVINIVCEMYKNYGDLKWMESVCTHLTLCLVLLWFVKLFCMKSALFEPLTRCMRLARRGLAALLVVPCFLLPLIILCGAVVALKFAIATTADVRQAVVTMSWAALGQTRLEEEWAVVVSVHLVTILVLLPLAVAMAGATMSYNLVAEEKAEGKAEGVEPTATVFVPL